MVPFAVSIFLSAFLLFQIQPMIGKIILPWFGGTPAVWSTVMLFFQNLLLAGYAYANWLIKNNSPARQKTIHLSLIAFTILYLAGLSLFWDSPITPDASWKPQTVDQPVVEIFKLLLICIGLPYFILAANGPLMQAWFNRAYPDQSYARLYSLSNFGSLLGLLAYPFMIEPFLSLHIQGRTWSAGFLLFGLLSGLVNALHRSTPPPAKPTADPSPRADPPTLPILLWIALSATASVFLLAVTNQISQEVAVIPFLWIIPLTIYLLSFIFAFSSESAYNRTTFAVLFVISTAFTLYVMLNVTALHVYWQIIAYCTLLFAACVICHGELYRLRPAGAHLTTFYLTIALGGAFGGIFVSLIAPAIFNGYWEFFVGLATTVAIVMAYLRNSGTPATRTRFIFAVFGLTTITLAIVSRTASGILVSERNFYGVIRVRLLPIGDNNEPAYAMSHGITVHGLQFVSPEVRDVPTTYYVRDGGAGLAILNHPNYAHTMRVGLLGLGIGTLAAYGQPGDQYRLYEINPVVVELAHGKGDYFSFLSDSKADVHTVLGDARISLERELSEGKRQNFDVLVLDTFSSDSIPVHLVTKEAFELYLAHLAPDGIIAAHITNLHLDLQPVFWQLAEYFNLSMVRVNYDGDSNGGYASHWMLLALDPAALDIPAIQERAVNLDRYSTNLRLWTDDYSNLVQILK